MVGQSPSNGEIYVIFKFLTYVLKVELTLTQTHHKLSSSMGWFRKNIVV